MNLLEILTNKNLQQKINKEYQIKVDYNKIKWVANITLVETSIFILLTYFKECYNIGANELSYILQQEDSELPLFERVHFKKE